MADRNAVPCNGCRACCRREQVGLSPERGDDPLQYCTVPYGDGERMLAHRDNGDYVYLGDDGCTIHDRAPWACRMFDCRRWLAGSSGAMQDLLRVDDPEGDIIRAAHERLHTLETGDGEA